MATPPDFTTGQVLTAAQMNQIGVWKIIPTGATNGTVGADGDVTIGNAVSSVTVDGVFSADYRAYHIIASGGALSTGSQRIDLTLGTTTTGYYGLLIFANYSGAGLSTASGNAQSNAAWNYLGIATTAGISIDAFLNGPYETIRTTCRGNYISTLSTGNPGFFNGFLDNTTSYTSFKIAPLSGTLTGGVIQIYGYK